jgi:hypothetical protein
VWAARNATLSILPTAFSGIASSTKNAVGRLLHLSGWH